MSVPSLLSVAKKFAHCFFSCYLMQISSIIYHYKWVFEKCISKNKIRIGTVSIKVVDIKYTSKISKTFTWQYLSWNNKTTM